MTVSRLRVAKSETRDLAERDRARIVRTYGEPSEWQQSNGWFMVALIAVAAALAIFALVLR